VEFYRDVFACDAMIHDPDAALLLAPDGFQMYLIARGTKAQHPSGGLGLQYLIWTADSSTSLERLEHALKARGSHTGTHTSGEVTFVAGRDPDGIRVVVVHPSPTELPRSVVGPRFYS
jgi:hypothetical protein